MILSIQGVDGDVDQMEDHFTAVHVSVRVLWCKENIISLCCTTVILYLYVYHKIDRKYVTARLINQHNMSFRKLKTE